MEDRIHISIVPASEPLYASPFLPSLRRGASANLGAWGNVIRAAGFDPAEHKKQNGKCDRSKAELWVRGRLAKRQPVRWQDAPTDLDDFVRRRLGMN